MTPTQIEELSLLTQEALDRITLSISNPNQVYALEAVLDRAKRLASHCASELSESIIQGVTGKRSLSDDRARLEAVLGIRLSLLPGPDSAASK